jgi:hypothetical protein
MLENIASEKRKMYQFRHRMLPKEVQIDVEDLDSRVSIPTDISIGSDIVTMQETKPNFY